MRHPHDVPRTQYVRRRNDIVIDKDRLRARIVNAPTIAIQFQRGTTVANFGVSQGIKNDVVGGQIPDGNQLLIRFKNLTLSGT